jgi:hypothetical protein
MMQNFLGAPVFYLVKLGETAITSPKVAGSTWMGICSAQQK